MLDLKIGLLHDHPLHTKLGKKKVITTQEILNIAQPYITLEENLNTRFDNPTSTIDVISKCLSGKDSRKQREDVDREIYGHYNIYIPLKTSWALISSSKK